MTKEQSASHELDGISSDILRDFIYQQFTEYFDRRSQEGRAVFSAAKHLIACGIQAALANRDLSATQTTDEPYSER